MSKATPMDPNRRMKFYRRGNRKVTPRQRRRFMKKIYRAIRAEERE